MPDETSDTQPSAPIFEIAEPREGVTHLYANAVVLTWTGSDLTANIYQIIQPNRDIPSQKEAPNRLLNSASVTLTWSSAKIFQAHLKEAIDRYEKVYGPIKTEFQAI
jgi:hypothetical protein